MLTAPERWKAVAPMKSCFIITPIGASGSEQRLHADLVQSQAVNEALNELGYDVIRADKMLDPGMINSSIFDAILDSDLCIADLTFLNPNVFYEIGIRHVIKKPIIHIAHNDTKIPFDNVSHRVVFFNRFDLMGYDSLKNEIINLVKFIESDGYVLSNPFTQAVGLKEFSSSGDDSKQLIADITERLRAMERAGAGSAGTAAAIQGQGELATMNLDGLIAQLRSRKLDLGHDTEARTAASAAISAISSAQSQLADISTQIAALAGNVSRLDTNFSSAQSQYASLASIVQTLQSSVSSLATLSSSSDGSFRGN